MTGQNTADEATAARLHALVMDLVRTGGFLDPDQSALPDRPLTLSQGFALYELDVSGPLSQRALSERLRLDKSSVSRIAADLQAQGLVERERDPADRRVLLLRITGAGRALRSRLASGFNARFDAWTSRMSPAELDALLVGLPALIRVMHEEQEEEPRRSRDSGAGSPAR
ncbi:MarR family winged helix-turn-helix transcriptional regulator [Nocardiopsis composta]|uniref:DNA-binding MarR family transcriptional regulator n=1 Tax=Nocardiopsis composta TaxID=157465 RepID=A0A7W8VH21_9ACTN|nr:MarR family transcriptional regulator [Nocardiopsis composta]MBB5435579.1 DNA-binding MarR family transcriptional regulator [Nocardiopsis composta]